MGGLMGGGAGSRGSRTFSAPPPTNTAPSPAAPIQRTITPTPGAQQPGFNPGLQRPGFGRGLMGGLAGGLLGAGLFGLLTGNGFFGGIGGFFSIIGFLFQIALLAVLARFAFNWWQTRNLAPAGAGPRPTMAAFTGGAGFGAGAAPQRPKPLPLQLSAADFPAFERLLGRDARRLWPRGRRPRWAGSRRPKWSDYFNEELDQRRPTGPRQPHLRRQAFAGRPRRSVAGRARRIRHGRDAFRADRRDAGARHGPGCFGRSDATHAIDRGLDLPSPGGVWPRRLETFGDPAGGLSAFAGRAFSRILTPISARPRAFSRMGARARF